MPEDRKIHVNTEAQNSLREVVTSEEKKFVPPTVRRLRSIILHERSFADKLARVRLNECHDWTWSSKLWKRNSKLITYIIIINVVVYVALAYWATVYDGFTGIDNMYLITATLTTVGIGDVSPRKPWTRIIAVVMFPYGLIIFAFIMALAAASVEYSIVRANQGQAAADDAYTTLFNPTSPVEGGSVKTKRRGNQKKAKLNSGTYIVNIGGTEVNLLGTPLTVASWLMKYALVIFIGALFFRFYDKEREAQKDYYVDMTWIDTFYYATVIATTVGYGHKITTHTFGGKLFLCFYFLFSTFVIGTILGHFSNLYILIKKNYITNTIINDVTKLHEVDLTKDGKISEAEFVIFKLMQLQQLDKKMLIRLSTQFAEYDFSENGQVVIGQDVPSAKQVAEMKAQLTESGLILHSSDHHIQEEDSWLLVNLWKRRLKQRHEDHKRNYLETGSRFGSNVSSSSVEDEDRLKIQDLDFSWSKILWWQAAKDTGYIAFTLLLVYLLLSYYVFVHDSETMNAIQGWYFIAGTLSTVGFGDYAPVLQRQRLFTIGMIPFGLVILGFFISFARAWALSMPHKEQKVQEGSIRRVFEQLNIPENGYLTKQQFVENSKMMAMSAKRAEVVFDKLDTDKTGTVGMYRRKKFSKTLLGKFLIILFKIYGTIALGAVAIKYWPSEEKLNWVDAFYFTTVTATSIGYGDIIPTTDSFRVFMTFYMLISTIIVGFSLNEAMDLYLRDVMAEKLFKFFIASPTYVHKADVDNSDEVSEAEFILFKLQQMQKIDKAILNKLIDTFEEMDFDHTRMLVIGLHIPNKIQVEEMREEIKNNPKLSMEQAWEVKKRKIMTDLGFDENNKLVWPLKTLSGESEVLRNESIRQLSVRQQSIRKISMRQASLNGGGTATTTSSGSSSRLVIKENGETKMDSDDISKQSLPSIQLEDGLSLEGIELTEEEMKMETEMIALSKVLFEDFKHEESNTTTINNSMKVGATTTSSPDMPPPTLDSSISIVDTVTSPLMTSPDSPKKKAKAQQRASASRLSKPSSLSSLKPTSTTSTFKTKHTHTKSSPTLSQSTSRKSVSESRATSNGSIALSKHRPSHLSPPPTSRVSRSISPTHKQTTHTVKTSADPHNITAPKRRSYQPSSSPSSQYHAKPAPRRLSLQEKTGVVPTLHSPSSSPVSSRSRSLSANRTEYPIKSVNAKRASKSPSKQLKGSLMKSDARKDGDIIKHDVVNGSAISDVSVRGVKVVEESGGHIDTSFDREEDIKPLEIFLAEGRHLSDQSQDRGASLGISI